MSFKDQINRTAKCAILDTGEFAETITFTPYGGSAKSIKAVVDRHDLNTIGVDQNLSLSRQCRVHVANDATYGITSVNERQDKVTLPPVEGETAVDWLVSRVLYKDEGMWGLLCTR